MIDYFFILLLIFPLVVIGLLFRKRLSYIIVPLVMLSFFMFVAFIVFPNLLFETESIKTLPSDQIPFIMQSGETKTVNVTMINIIQNITVDKLQLYIPAIDTYHWSISQYEKEKTTDETYKNLEVTIYSKNQTNITYLSNFTTQPYIINSSNVPWLFPIVENTTYNITYTFTAPINVSNGTVFVMPPLIENQITQIFKQPEQGIDWFNVLFSMFPLFISIPMLIYILFFSSSPVFKKKKRKKKDLEILLEHLEEMNKKLDKIPKNEKKTVESKYGEIPKQQSDYTLVKMTTPDEAITLAKKFREEGYWVKIANFSKESKNIDKENCCGVYISNWKKDEYEIRGRPKWK